MARTSTEIESDSAISYRRNPLSRWCLIGLFSLSLSIGAGIAAYALILPAFQVWSARDWAPVPCVVVSSEVEANRGMESDTYRVKIVYDYVIDGKEYRSERYQFLGGTSSGFASKQAIVNRYPPRLKTVCFVDPAVPSSAVINRDLTPDMLFGLVGVVFLVIGVGGVYYMVFRFRPMIDAASGSPESLCDYLPSPHHPSTLGRRDVFTAEQQVLTSDHQRRTGVFSIVILVAVFGVVLAILFWDVLWGQGIINRGVQVFAVLLGLGAAAISGRFLLKLRNPQLTLRISPVCLGDTLTVDWEFSAHANSIRRLQLSVVGQENTRKKKETFENDTAVTFAKYPVLDTTAEDQIPAGTATVVIPADTMHSFDGEYNRVEWSVSVVGEVGWWPNVPTRL